MNDVYAERRARVRSALGDNGVLILSASPELHVGDTELPYVVDSEMYYLTGYAEPEAVMILNATAFSLFVRPRDPARELWTGVRGGVESVHSAYAADDGYSIEDLTSTLPSLVAGYDRLYVRNDAGRPEVDAVIKTVLSRARRNRARSGRGPVEVVDPGVILDVMRMRKDQHELHLMRQAAAITVAAFRDAARAVRAGAGEWEIEAALRHGFRSRRASGESFGTIAGAGANATVLHYRANDDVLVEGDFILMDAGARFGMYCADVTRTYAVGHVSDERMAIHDIVRAAHDAALAVCRVGRTIEDVDAAARRVLVQGMIDLGLVDGPVDKALGNDAHKRYYPHRTCHWLGLDVHDVGPYVDAGRAVTLEPGMVFTVEPGLYIPADDERARASIRGVGVRLENDVLITPDGAEVLTGDLPLDADAGRAHG